MFSGEDDDDFIPATNSKLASLFEQTTVKGNPSLTYTAPKQPRKSRAESTQGSSQPAKLDIIIVKAVQTFKLEDGHYNSQGKLGAAVLGNTVSKLYQLLLYKSKQQHITSTKITNKLKFTVQPKNYASFYDDRGQNWSLMFESEEDVVEFAREIGLARALGEKGEQPFHIQDLKVGEGITAELGDLVEIRYTTLPIVNDGLGKAIETNVEADKPQRVKLRKDVWEESLIGSTKGSKKQIILSPVLFGPWKALVNSNISRLAIEVEIGRIKSEKKNRSNVSSSMIRHPESSESNVDSSTDETSIKARGASISEALTNSPKTHKASIISRMARMGQATLPLKGAVMCNPSDSEETEEEVSVATSNTILPKSLSKTRLSSAKSRALAASPVPAKEVPTSTTGMLNAMPYNAPLNQQLAVFQTGNVNWNQQQMHPGHQAQYLINSVPMALPSHVDTQLYSAPISQVVPLPQVSTPSSVSPSESHLAVYIAENRTHNAEVRMGLTKVTDKVDQALLKLDKMNERAGGVLEPATLLNSIQKLVSDNELLQNELVDKRLKIEQQNEKIFQLLSQKVSEQNNLAIAADRQDNSLQNIIIALQQEKTKLTEDLKETSAKTHTLQDQSKELQEENSRLTDKINTLTSSSDTLQLELEQQKQIVQDLKSEINKLQGSNEEKLNLCNAQENTITTLNANIKELQKARDLLIEELEESKQQLKLARTKSADHIETKEKAIAVEEQILKCTEEVKAKYEEIIKQMEHKHEDLTMEVNSLKAELKNTEKTQLSPAGDDVKKVMNVLFKLLKSEFIPTSNYDGSSIIQTILSIIQDVTLQYLNMKMKSGVQASENSKAKEKVVVNDSTKTKVVDSKDQNAKDEVNMSSDDFTIESGDPVDNMIKDKIESYPTCTKQSDSEIGVIAQMDGQNEGLKQYKPNEKETLFNETELYDPLSTKKPIITQSKEQESSMKVGNEIEVKEEKPASHKTERAADQAKDNTLGSSWRPQPPPPPQFDEEEDDDDWLS